MQIWLCLWLCKTLSLAALHCTLLMAESYFFSSCQVTLRLTDRRNKVWKAFCKCVVFTVAQQWSLTVISTGKESVLLFFYSKTFQSRVFFLNHFRAFFQIRAVHWSVIWLTFKMSFMIHCLTDGSGFLCTDECWDFLWFCNDHAQALKYLLDGDAGRVSDYNLMHYFRRLLSMHNCLASS